MAAGANQGPRRISAGLAWGLVIAAGCGALGPVQSDGEAPLPPLDASEVARGRQVYLQYCAICHGPNAQGVPNWQQPEASGDLPPPPHDDTGHTWRHSDAQLGDIIRNGQRDPFNRSPDLTMPPFKDQLREEEIAAVIAYFKSLWSLEHRRFQEEQNQRQTLPMPGAEP